MYNREALRIDPKEKAALEAARRVTKTIEVLSAKESAQV